MIDYAEDDAIDILFSDPFFEILRQTRHTFLVLFSGGIHGVFFTSEVDTARAHHARPPAQTEIPSATPTTDNGSQPLSSAELATLTTEVDTLVASLHLPGPPTPLVPRAPWMRDGDLRSDEETDAAWQSSVATMLPSTIRPVPPSDVPHPDDWLLDPDADVGFPSLRFHGHCTVRFLLADPAHRAVKRGAFTSLVKFSDET